MKKVQSKDATCCVSTRTDAIHRGSTKGPKEHPILMKPFLIEAIMNTKIHSWPPEPINPEQAYKGMTRRIIKPASKSAVGFVMTEDYRGNKWPCEIDEHERMFDNYLKCPFGQPGDLLWVKEKYFDNWEGLAEDEIFDEDGDPYPHYMQYLAVPEKWIDRYGDEYERDDYKWKSPLFMPKAAARIWLQIVDVQPERLQDISDENAIWEGISQCRDIDEPETPLYYFYPCNDLRDDSYIPNGAKVSFYSLWRSINGKTSWHQNPWVWVISFKVISTTGRPDPALLPVLPGVSKSSENH